MREDPAHVVLQHAMEATETLRNAPGEEAWSTIEALFHAPSPVREPSPQTDFADQLEQLERAMDPTSGAARLPHAMASTAHLAHRLSLQSILLEMERFVARVKGMDGLPLALSIEQIRSVQQLREELPDYALLLASHGAAAERHLAHVRRMLDRLGP